MNQLENKELLSALGIFSTSCDSEFRKQIVIHLEEILKSMKELAKAQKEMVNASKETTERLEKGLKFYT